MNLALLLEAAARSHPDKTALISPGMTLSFRELNAYASRLAHGFVSRGLGSGDKIALSCPTMPAFAISYYAILKIGAVAVPFNLLLKRDEIAEQLRASETRAYICFEGTEQFPMGQQGLAAFEMAPKCEHLWIIPSAPHGLHLLPEQQSWFGLLHEQPAVFESVQLPGDATCSITFSSGTTGDPKGVEHSHSTEYLASVLVRDELGIRNEDVALSALPLFSLWRCAILHATCLSASTAVLLPRFQPAEVWQAIGEHKVSVFYGVSAMYYGMHMALSQLEVDSSAIARHWRTGLFGGAPLDPQLRQFFCERFGLHMQQGYGLTEIIFAVLDNVPDEVPPGLIGRTIPGVQVRIVDEDMNDVPEGEMGEIIVRSPTVMKGYYQHPEWTEEAFRGGWFHTGDAGRRDEDGNLYLLDRIKDMINRGGFKVYPAQLERVLMGHPDIANTAIIGVPDERLGEEIKAFIVLKEGASPTEDDIVSWTRERVGGHSYVRKVEFVASLPVGPTGKVMKKILREQVFAASA
jgi:long-chain acyl-CoA synthetase